MKSKIDFIKIEECYYTIAYAEKIEVGDWIIYETHEGPILMKVLNSDDFWEVVTNVGAANFKKKSGYYPTGVDFINVDYEFKYKVIDSNNPVFN